MRVDMVKWKEGDPVYPGYILKVAYEEADEFSSESYRDICFRIVLLKKGTLVMKMNNKNMVVTSPSILCLNDKDQVLINSTNPYQLSVVYFHPSVVNSTFDLNNIFGDEFEQDGSISLHQDKDLFLTFTERNDSFHGCINMGVALLPHVSELLKKLEKELGPKINGIWPCKSRSYLIELLILLQQKYYEGCYEEEALVDGCSLEEMSDVLDFIHSNYSAQITLSLLTKKFNINRNTLNQRFIELTGNTPISYLINHRLKIANSILTNTQVPIYEICERTGFGDLANFSRSFKKCYGESPASFRKKYSTM